MTPARELELLSTAMAVLSEAGYEALSMDVVAARGRCSKATLYRQWQTKPRMVAAALYATRPVDHAGIDTGSLRGDLLALGREIADHAQKDAALFAAMGHAVMADEELATAVRAALVEPENRNLSRLVERAVDRGELHEWPPAAEFPPQLLFGTVISRPLFDPDFTDVDYVTRFIERVVLPALLGL